MVRMAHVGQTADVSDSVPEFTEQQSAFPWHQLVPTARTTNVCILADDQLFRAGCEYLLSKTNAISLEVSLASVEPNMALAALESSAPEAIVIGVAQLTEQTIALLSTLREARPHTGFIVVFGYATQKVVQSLRAVSSQTGNGFACVNRDTITSDAQLVQLIESVVDGRIMLDPRLLDRFLTPEVEESALIKRLSNREVEVLHLMASGLTNPGIAAELCLERKTIERHINSIYAKLSEKADEGHPRVHTILAYLAATGRLDTEA